MGEPVCGGRLVADQRDEGGAEAHAGSASWLQQGAKLFLDGTSRFFATGNTTNAPDPRDWLAAIIDGSDDAIVSKNLDGIIQTWNDGAARLFGYAAGEVIGKPITILIPPDRIDEEPMILAQIQAGKRVDHFETKRRRKDGSLVDISLTISPIRSERGVIVGASKIARDVTERLRAQEQQKMLMGEMQHRVKNLFSLAQAIVSISAKSSHSQTDIVADVKARLSSLARAHDLMLVDRTTAEHHDQQVGLLRLIKTVLEPYSDGDRISIAGEDCRVGQKTAPNLTLLLHELATNAAKYGSLSADDGRLAIDLSLAQNVVRILWTETGGPEPSLERSPGFGSRLERGLASALGTTVDREWKPTGLVASISISKETLRA